MPKQNIPKKILDVLKTVKDPDTGGDVLEMKMIQNIRISGKKVTMKLVPPSYGCAFCGIINSMAEEIKNKLNKAGYKADVEIGF